MLDKYLNFLDEGVGSVTAKTGAKSFVNFQRIRKGCELQCKQYLVNRPMYIKCVKQCEKEELRNGRK